MEERGWSYRTPHIATKQPQKMHMKHSQNEKKKTQRTDEQLPRARDRDEMLV